MLRWFVRSVLCACLIIVSTAIVHNPATAQDIAMAKDPEVIEVPDVVVSATKTPMSPKHVTSAVEVIKGEELEKRKIKTVVDALRLAQGVAIFSNGGPGTSANVRIRGGKAEHTLVLIDGAIVNDPASGAFDFANLTTENIEQIEILRGAQSMLWGADAIGGVIHITTKKGRGQPVISGFMEYGSYASFREGGSVSGAKGPVDFSVSLSRWDTSSFSAINYRRGATERDGHHNMQVSARMGIQLPHEGRLDFSLRWWDASTAFDGLAGDATASPADIFGSHSSSRNLMLSGSYEQPLTSWWTQKLTLSQNTSKSLQNSGPVGRNLATGEAMTPDGVCFATNCFFPFRFQLEVVNRRLEWQNNFKFWDPLLITVGYQFREDQGDNPSNFFNPSNKILSSHAGFAQAQLNIADRLFLTAGGRHDSYNAFGDATTYRVTGGYLIKETGTKIRASYATGFRAPTMNQLFFVDPSFPTPIPDLKPEKSKSMDVGVDQSFFGGKVKISGGYFWNRYTNLIQFVFAPPLIGLSNVGQAQSKGYEVSVSAQVLQWLEIHGQYTRTMTRDLSQNVGARLPQWPVDSASAGFTLQPIEALYLTLDYRHVGARTNTFPLAQMDSFHVFSGSLSFDVMRQIQVYGRIENALNTRYEELLNFGVPSLSIFGGIKASYELPL